MKKSLAIILFFCSLTVAQAKIKIPSLIEELSELSSGDSTKVLVLQKLAVELLQSNYDSSLVCARNALALSIQSGEDKIIASSLRQLGDIETYQTELEKEGLSHLYQALAKYKKIENPEGECLTFCNIGSLLVFYDSSYNKGINFLFDALQIAERIHRDNLKLKALNHIAAANFLIQSYAEAIIYYKQCLAIAEKDKSPEGLYMQAEITGNISLCLLTPSDFKEGFDYLKKAIELAELIKNDRLLAAGYLNLAEYYINNKDGADLAIQFSEKARPIAVRIKHSDMLFTLDGIMGRAHLEKKNKKLGSYFLKRCLDSAIAHDDFDLQSEVHQAFYKMYKSEGRWRDALLEHELFKNANDKEKNNEKIELITGAEARYQGQLKEQRIKTLQADNIAIEVKRVAVVRYFTLVIVSLLFLGGAIYYFRDRYNRKVQRLNLEVKLRDQKDKIRQELHDNLGSQLSSISIGLNQLIRNENNNIKSIQEIADHALTELRNSLWIMDKEWISIEEIEHRINNLFLQYRKIEVPVDLQLFVDEALNNFKLPSGKAGHLYRIVQEATHNSIKHSRANCLSITFKKMEAAVAVTISDDGVGFDLKKIQGNERYGLKNIYSRAEQMNAKLTMESSEGNGMKIVLQFAITEFSEL